MYLGLGWAILLCACVRDRMMCSSVAYTIHLCAVLERDKAEEAERSLKMLEEHFRIGGKGEGGVKRDVVLREMERVVLKDCPRMGNRRKRWDQV